MPELPEVETVKSIVEPQIIGRKIKKIQIFRSEILAGVGKDDFCRVVQEQEVISMSRRGKFLTIHLAGGDSIVLHLRMTGQLLVTPPDHPQEKHTHIIFEMDGDRELRFSDVRRFGRFWLLRRGEEDHFTGRQKLGVEPFSEELTANYLQEKMGKRQSAIKTLLLEQTLIAGIGNIYADEILFRAGLHPQKQGKECTMQEWEKLAELIPETLQWGIETNRISPEDYLLGKGKEYRNTPLLKVYGRGGETCPRCGALLESVRIGGRGSTFCLQCQPQAGSSQVET